MKTWMKKANRFQIVKVQPGCCLGFALVFVDFSLPLPIKVLLIKKAYILETEDTGVSPSYDKNFDS